MISSKRNYVLILTFLFVLPKIALGQLFFDYGHDDGFDHHSDKPMDEAKLPKGDVKSHMVEAIHHENGTKGIDIQKIRLEMLIYYKLANCTDHGGIIASFSSIKYCYLGHKVQFCLCPIDLFVALDIKSIFLVVLELYKPFFLEGTCYIRITPHKRDKEPPDHKLEEISSNVVF